jgi:asparagine N-glycosylation enzyme membrane subunit Stt3
MFKSPESKKLTKSSRGTDLLILSGLFLFATGIRLLPWEHIFDSGKVYLYDPDCYIRLRKIVIYLSSFPATSVYDYFEGFPKGTGVISPPTLEYIIAAFFYPFQELKSLTVILEKVVALLPPLIGGTTIIILYGFVNNHFGKLPALISALILTLLPPNIEATVLGRFDNEMLEPLLLILTYWTYIKTYANEERLSGWFALGMVSALFLMFWRGALIPLAIIGIDILYRFFFSRPSERAVWHLCKGAAIMYLTLSGIFAIICITDIWGTGYFFSYNIISWFHVALFGISSLFFLSMRLISSRLILIKKPAVLSLIAIIIISSVIILKSDIVKGLSLFTSENPWLNSVMEYQPLFQHGSSLTKLLTLYGGLFFISPFFLIFLRSHVFNDIKAKNFLIIWTVIMFLAVIARQRFALYYAINAAVMAGVVLYYLTEKGIGKGSLHRKALLISFIIVLSLLQLPTFPYMINHYKYGVGYTIKGDIEEALLWLRDKTPNPGNPYRPQVKPLYGVLARWDYGGWIESVAQRPVVATNFGTETYGMEAVSRFFLSSDESEMENVLKQNRVRYILLDNLLADLSMYAELIGEKKRFFVEKWSPELNRSTYIPTKEYYSLIISRLFYSDGSMTEVGPVTFNPVEGVRLVHETKTPSNIYGFPWEIKRLKVFEYIHGAVVSVKGVPGKSVTLSQPIETNQGRRFIYNNIKVFREDGMVNFTLLYPPKANQLSVGAVGPAVLSDGYKKRELNITDSEIQQGKIFYLSFLK